MRLRDAMRQREIERGRDEDGLHAGCLGWNDIIVDAITDMNDVVCGGVWRNHAIEQPLTFEDALLARNEELLIPCDAVGLQELGHCFSRMVHVRD